MSKVVSIRVPLRFSSPLRAPLGNERAAGSSPRALPTPQRTSSRRDEAKLTPQAKLDVAKLDVAKLLPAAKLAPQAKLAQAKLAPQAKLAQAKLAQAKLAPAAKL